MDLTAMYDHSPDWLKLVWVLLPHVTTWVITLLILTLMKPHSRTPTEFRIVREDGTETKVRLRSLPE